MRLFFTRLRESVKFPEGNSVGQIFWRGAFYGLLILSLSVIFMAGAFFNTGLPVWVLPLVALLLGVGIFWLSRFTGALLHMGISKIPTAVFALLFSTVITLLTARSIRFGLPTEVFFLGSLIFILSITLLFGSIAVLRSKASSVRWMHLISIFVSVLSISFCVYFLTKEGHDPYQVDFTPTPAILLSSQGYLNPGSDGVHDVIHFTYGSGTDQRRAEFNDRVRFKTPTVDASRLLPEWKGSKAKWRERFWGFGVKNFPLNGRVWMPQGEGTFPLFLIVHGNHGMEDYSDAGYEYIGKHLASRGVIVVSVDENFINGTWSGDFRGREMPTRGWLLLKHLEQWKAWSNDNTHELFQKADLSNIILAGHSRGGEAAPIAARFNKLPFFPDDANEKFDFDFGIKGIISIAPTDKRYERRIELENINYLSIQGSYDSDEASFFGYRQFQRVTFSDSSYHLKAGVYIHGANHGQFNTSWGKYDGGPPGKWLLNTAPMITMEEQQQIAKVYIGAFVESVFNQKDYSKLLANAQSGADWLPKVIVLNTFSDSHTKDLITFEEDIDVTTGTTTGSVISSAALQKWREETLKFRDDDTQANNAVIIGWMKDSTERTAHYKIDFARSVGLDSTHSLLLTMARGDENSLKSEDTEKGKKDESPGSELNFEIHLTDSLGGKAVFELNDIKKLSPRLQVQFVKLKGLHKENFGDTWEPTLETVELPLGHSYLSHLKTIEFVFNKSEKGVLILDNIGLRKTQ
ncbi:MAG TPA: hypothetical protein PKJ63_00890 [Cyclobacteriaceae bacterium]|nr:hypothetical protein [Cyclobacteriaceae bacterium]